MPQRKKRPPVVVIDGEISTWMGPDVLVGRVIEWEDPIPGTPREPSQDSHSKPRIELNAARQEFRIDGKWHRLKGEKHVVFLDALIKQAGEWIVGKDLDDPQKKERRPDKILRSLPEAVQEIIEARLGPSGGYRIKPEYF